MIEEVELRFGPATNATADRVRAAVEEAGLHPERVRMTPEGGVSVFLLRQAWDSANREEIGRALDRHGLPGDFEIRDGPKHEYQ